MGRWCESEELRGGIGGNMTEIHCMNFSKNEHIIRKEEGSEGRRAHGALVGMVGTQSLAKTGLRIEPIFLHYTPRCEDYRSVQPHCLSLSIFGPKESAYTLDPHSTLYN